MNCEKCNQKMKEIGPFAHVKFEGFPSDKSVVSSQYQCINEKCQEFGKIDKHEQ